MEQICQSCAMPLEGEALGTNKDGSPNADYCKYCYVNGAFTGEMTMEEMIEACVPYMAKPEVGMTEAQAREIMQSTLPQLKRWKKD